MNIFDYDYTPEPVMDQSMWESMAITEQVEYLDRAWEEKMDQYAPRNCDEGDWAHPGELDQGDYYELSPNGDCIPW